MDEVVRRARALSGREVSLAIRIGKSEIYNQFARVLHDQRHRRAHRAQAGIPRDRPDGPLAPPTRRARLHSRWCSRYGGANAGRLARKAESRAAFDVQQSPGFSRGQGGVHAPAAEIVRREQNLSRAPAASAPPIFDS